MEFEKTTLTLGDTTILEPVTALTNLCVAGVCLYAFCSLRSRNQSTTYLKYYFLTMTAAMLYSAIFGHALQLYFSFGWKVPGWLISMFSVTLLERASIAHAEPLLTKKQCARFTTINTVELLVLNAVVLSTLNFKVVEAHAAYGLLIVVASFEFFIYKTTRAASSKDFLIAASISALAGLVHLTQFTIHPWFNHLDLSHVLMTLAAYKFYRGGRKLEKTPPLVVHRPTNKKVWRVISSQNL